MGKIIMAAVVAYLLWTVFCYIRWRTPPKAKKPNVLQDIVGKSKFEKITSKSMTFKTKPFASTAAKIEKEAEKQDTFVPQNGIEIPFDELDELFSEEENEPLNIDFPLEYYPSEDDEEIDGAGLVSNATGIRFGELGNMVKTVDRITEAIPEDKEAAGNALLEIRQTDMFEQLVSAKPDRREIVAQLIEESLAAFCRRNSIETESTEMQQVPDDFNIENYV
ncbi:MAG: hypothetical protein LBH82_03220 [Bacteroidales bacterium]|jgi:hypothetical protein|nr:hypothetical protein [Bacteroidales bacterium]